MNKFFDTGKKIYGSKIAKASRDFLLGKDMDLSDEAYKEKYGYYKPDNSVGIMGMLVTPEGEGVEHLVKGITGFGGVKYNAGLEALETEKAAKKALKTYDIMTKRDAFLKERFGKVGNEFTPSEQYGLKVRFGDKGKLKKGGVVKAQNGTITPYYNPNPINEGIRKTVDNVPALRSIKRGIQHYKSSPMHDIASFVIPDDINSAMIPVAGGIKGATNTMFNRTKAGGSSKRYYDQLLSKLEQIPEDKMSKPLIKQIKDFYSACKISIAKQNPATSRLYKQGAEEAGQKAVNMADNVLIDINREKELLKIQQQQQRAKNIVPHNAKTQAIIDSDFTPFDEMKTLQQTGSRAKTTMNFRMSDMMGKDGGVIKA